MFGGNLELPKYYKRRPKPKPMTYDIQLPTLKPGVYGHIGREYNTDYHVRWGHYRQRLRAADVHYLESEAKRLRKEISTGKHERRIQTNVFHRRVQERFKEKVKTYEEWIDGRRKRLKELLCQEINYYLVASIEITQKGVYSKLQAAKDQAQRFKAQRESARQETIKQKLMLQYMNDCHELRPALAQRNLMETKKIQLLQIKENEIKKEAERELEGMWHNVMMKEVESKKEQEIQDYLKQQKAMNESIEVWDKQIYGKKLMMQEAAHNDVEEHIEMVKVQEQLRREEIEALDAKRRKRDQVAKELLQQIAEHERYMIQRKQEEEALGNALSRLAQMELDREKQKIRDTTAQARREMAIYRQHLKELAEERKKEDEQLNALLHEHRRMVEKKQQEAYCAVKRAKEESRKNVLAGRVEQLEYKKREAENQLKLQEAENELCRMAYETNERLQAESDRLQAEEVKQYRKELKQQIESNNEKRRLEKEQLERELAEGLAEEERRRQHVLEIINYRLDDPSFKHPLRQLLEPICPCPDKH